MKKTRNIVLSVSWRQLHKQFGEKLVVPGTSGVLGCSPVLSSLGTALYSSGGLRTWSPGEPREEGLGRQVPAEVFLMELLPLG